MAKLVSLFPTDSRVFYQHQHVKRNKFQKHYVYNIYNVSIHMQELKTVNTKEFLIT